MNQPVLNKPAAAKHSLISVGLAHWRAYCLIALLTFAFSYGAAHWSRIEQLAIFWPINALLIGLIVRVSIRLNVLTWLVIALALLAADHLAQTPFLRSLIMTAGNLVQVYVAIKLFNLLPPKVVRLKTVDSVIYLFFICLISCAAAAVTVAMGFTLINEWRQMNVAPSSLFGEWLVTSLVDMTLILPVLLAWPDAGDLMISDRRQALSWSAAINWQQIRRWVHLALPLLSLVMLLLLGLAIGGYGAIMLPIPAVLWCALSYRLFTTVVINFAVCLWQIYANTIDLYQLDFSIVHAGQAISLRLGITMLSLCPIMVACIHRNNLEINAELNRALDHDTLTQCLSRSAFFRYGNKQLNNSSNKQPLALMMLDLDHFKRVNDNFGHGIGDLALRHAVQQIQQQLREEDLFARLGGEEFAVMIRPPTYQDAMRFAERLRASVDNNPLILANGSSLPLAISIGLVYYNQPPALPLNVMLVVADEALYEAKRKGRNRVVATHIA